ncbi:radical SAM protein [Streptomyces sp. NBC_01591]|uniref:B12-binding domain-containing radical SAM protein n=1 Tax=Streptomyces sp. NBC_01591 TaxID=2975888 RepID=UPI002DD8449B|nr:radical SAM protein [Streptomyces sp. NBC_01591]WSD71852.1 radical SAM protein [Streptomyces sp. NBC_01591]
MGDSIDAESFLERCRRRRARLADDLGAAPDRTRYFPVLAVLAPVMTQAEGEITYPGDPMALYAALSVAVHQAVHDAGPLKDATHYNDLAPEWTAFPSKAYRASVGHDGVRSYGTAPNTDQTVFDPRVWDDAARTTWLRLLREVRPRVVLISAVSPAHRYALEIAALVRTEVPGAYIVLGGRHADETVTVTPRGGRLLVKPSGTPAVIQEGKVPPVIDAVVAGEAYHTVDVLMRALALAMDLEDRWVDRARVLSCLQGLLQQEGVRPGKALVLFSPRGAGEPSHAVPLDGPALDLASLPSPYEAFAIRSYFPIFDDAESGDPLRTAHFMVSSACPYRCNFCSESARVGHGLRRFRDDAIGKAIERICEYVSYGGEAVFFDDSVFWSGRYKDMTEFCRELGRIREADPATLDPRLRAYLAGEDDTERLRNLQWGAQLTVDTLVALHSAEESDDVLRLMRDAGCSYVYIGIESMSSQVMDGIHKNLRREVDRPWAAKVREATALVKKHGLRLGTSVLFGLDGETRSSIDETIHEVGSLIDDGLIDLASPNILTYHPATPVTRQHGMHDRLDYHSPRVDNRKPYIYFEEAFPGVVSVLLTEEDIWHIHNETRIHWGRARNDTSVDTGPAAREPAGAAPGERTAVLGAVRG